MVDLTFFRTSIQQAASFDGKVMEDQGEAISRIKGLLRDTPKGALTDGQGRFTITNIQSGIYAIEISGVRCEKQAFKLMYGSKDSLICAAIKKVSTREIDKVVVTAESGSRDPELSAKFVQVVETREVKLKSVDSSEVIARIEGVNVQCAGGLGSNIHFLLNGLSGDEIHFFYDGIPFGLTPYVSGIANAPVNMINRVEIDKGVVPIQFGVDKHTLKLSVAPTYSYSTADDLLIDGEFDLELDDGELFDFVTGLEYITKLLDKRLENITFVKNYRQDIRIKSIDPSTGGTFIDECSVSNCGAGNGLKYTCSPRFSTKLSCKYAYCFPHQDEIFGNGQLIADNLELRPKSSHNINLPWAYGNKAKAYTEWLLQGNFFPCQMDDLIFLLVKNPEGFSSFQNVWSVTSEGFELSGRWKDVIEKLPLTANTTYQEYCDTSDTGPFVGFIDDRTPNTPYFFVNGIAAYELKDVFQKTATLPFSGRSAMSIPFSSIGKVRAYKSPRQKYLTIQYTQRTNPMDEH